MNKPYASIQFPQDESAHDNIVEWWYFNGHLKDAAGNEYSFMDCLFKVDIKKVNIPFLNKIPLRTSFFSHSLISDIKNKKFSHRISPLAIVSDDSFSKPLLYVNYINPELKSTYTSCAIEKVGDRAYHVKNEDLDLNMISTKQPLLEGGIGYLDLGDKSTYYYSLTNLETKGKIKVDGKWIEVSGKSWMDHQWADTSYSKDRWDWFSIQLDDNTELICCAYDDGKTRTAFADISYADGRQDHALALEMIPLQNQWISPKSKAVYPLSWDIKIPEKNINLRLRAKIEDQEMLFGSINYWEGPLEVIGSFNDNTVAGVGFMELVGYPSKYSNAKYLKDKIGQTIGQFLGFAKKSLVKA